MVRGGADPFYLKFWVTWPRWRKIADFQPIFARSSSAVTPSEKSSINTNRKSITCFPMSLRWSLYVAPKSPKGSQKRKTTDFCLKSYFACRKSAAKFLCVKTISGKVSCKAFIGLTIGAKMIGGGDPFCQKFWIKLTVSALERNRRFSTLFAHSDSAITTSEKLKLT